MPKSPPPPRDNGLLALSVELLAPLGAVRTRRMFGGHGLYLDGLFIALLADQMLFLRCDADEQAAFAAAGSQPFRYVSASGPRTVGGYWRAPDEAMDSPQAMAPWARRALASALRAAAAKAAAPAPKARPAARKTATPTGAKAAAKTRPKAVARKPAAR